MAIKKITLNELRSIVKQIIKEETMLNEDNLVLNNYAKQLYSLFKKEGATPLIMTGKNHTSPDVLKVYRKASQKDIDIWSNARDKDVKNYNVSIMVTNNGELHVGIKGVNKANAEKYANLVSKQFQDLQLKGNINFGTGWGGEQDSYADLTLIPKTTKKGGEVNPNQRPNAPKPQAQQQQQVSENLIKLRNYFK